MAGREPRASPVAGQGNSGNPGKDGGKSGADAESQALDSQLKAAGAMNAELKKIATAMEFPSERPPTSQLFHTSSGRIKARTFTARPPVDRARRIPRMDYTHNYAQLTDIANETRSLVTRLQQVHRRPAQGLGNEPTPAPSKLPISEAHHARNRRLFVERVAMENLKLYERLQRVRPSRDTASATLQKDWAAAQQYRRNCTKVSAGIVASRSPPPPRRAGGASRRRVKLAGATAEAPPAPAGLAVAVPTTTSAR